ncbi:TRAP transporter large permease [Muricomes sp. OA1]|uniref:TRAP transporter large permease n=1 Tax=Hungatella hathewayi TaxID=154046 RepID=A0A3E2WV17_9FIRM|nr:MULTISPECIES: TRAP transporter large permease [Clostridia]MCH1972109.1 TRAP transporter large permease [Muricomes sp. OA1]MSC85600.1 TRAP transporter large permease subunit [Eubacterium sp. BIOML-A1]MSD08055.1 TRAP transporter large permease subunit [Eubacterium sp. BIOML-A2]RGC31314.1 TRAP transporter large permease [Hungatella hathewayi]RYT13202.1 TRAP transporter large permease [Eubacterium sp. am_0171]
MDVAVLATIIMVAALIIFLIMGVPIAISIGLSSAMAMMVILPADVALVTCAQKMFTGLNSFPLLAIPFFVLAGNFMNNGGIAVRIVRLAEALCGKLPGPLAQSNIVANMFFGAISGSGNAAAAAMGGTIGPIEEERGYAKEYSAAVNIASAPTGMLIPPSNALIVFSTVGGSVSVAALFMGGYIPGILWGIAVMIVAGYMAKKRGYINTEKVSGKMKLQYFVQAIPSLILILIIIGGILSGIFTATEASGVAVVYAMVLSFIYKSITVKDLPKILLDSAKTTVIIVFLIGVSSIMSWIMAYTSIPDIIATAMLALTNSKIITLIIINIVLLLVGTFMDPTPAILIFTPIFMPICVGFGMSPIHFGIMLVYNLCIGAITPPVGTVLFTGCKIGKVTIEQVIKTLLPYFAAIIIVLLLVTYIPALSEFLPSLNGYI